MKSLTFARYGFYGAVAMIVLYTIGGFFIEWSIAVYEITRISALYAVVYMYAMQQRKLYQYSTQMEADRLQRCVNCGEVWHTAEWEAVPPVLTFKSRRANSCNCVDGHDLNCPQAPL